MHADHVAFAAHHQHFEAVLVAGHVVLGDEVELAGEDGAEGLVLAHLLLQRLQALDVERVVEPEAGEGAGAAARLDEELAAAGMKGRQRRRIEHRGVGAAQALLRQRLAAQVLVHAVADRAGVGIERTEAAVGQRHQHAVALEGGERRDDLEVFGACLGQHRRQVRLVEVLVLDVPEPGDAQRGQVLEVARIARLGAEHHQRDVEPLDIVLDHRGIRAGLVGEQEQGRLGHGACLRAERW